MAIIENKLTVDIPPKKQSGLSQIIELQAVYMTAYTVFGTIHYYHRTITGIFGAITVLWYYGSL